MNIHFSEDLTDFLPVFDDQCNRIVESSDPLIFYSLYSEFIDKLGLNSLVGPGLNKAESESQKKEQEFNALMLKAIDDNLKRFARYHSLEYKKKLVAIRKMIKQPDIISQTPFLRRITSALECFVKNSPFCRVMRKSLDIFQTSQEEFDNWLKRSCYVKQKHGLAKKISLAHLNSQKFLDKIFDPETSKPPSLLQKQVEWVDLDLNRFHLKALDTNYMATTNIGFCWHKMRLLQKCWSFKDPVSSHQAHKGKWNSIKDSAWESAVEIDLKLELLRTKQQMKKEYSSCKDSTSVRKNCEKLIKALRDHIHSEVCQIKNKKIENQAPSLQIGHLTKPVMERIERENLVVNHAKEYRAQFPLATNSEVFESQRKTLLNNAYSRTKWKRIIVAHDLDPRTDEEKQQASGRPSSKTRSQK